MEDPLVVVISPLVSLMETHCAESIEMGLSAYHFPRSTIADLDSADLLYSSPEFWTSDEGNKLLSKVSHRVVAVAADEIHVAPKW